MLKARDERTRMQERKGDADDTKGKKKTKEIRIKDGREKERWIETEDMFWNERGIDEMNERKKGEKRIQK